MRISREEFRNRTGLDIDAEEIIALREIKKERIEKIELMKESFLEKLLKNVPLSMGEDYPYRGSKIITNTISPKCLKIGQSFVQEDKIVSILELPFVLEPYAYITISKLPPCIIYTKNRAHRVAAFYIPPIIEVYNGESYILDGIHRSYIARGIGSTMNYIVVENPSLDPPFKPRSWRDIRIVKEKPVRMEERYFDIKPELFRLLKHVGIDG